MSDSAPGTGWWLASDGQWYPPSVHPDHQAWRRPESLPQDSGWWLASDGQWYPPAPDPVPALTQPAPTPHAAEVQVETGSFATLPRRVRLAAAVGLAVNVSALGLLVDRII